MWGCPPHAFVFRGVVIVIDDVLRFLSELLLTFPSFAI